MTATATSICEEIDDLATAIAFRIETMHAQGRRVPVEAILCLREAQAALRRASQCLDRSDEAQAQDDDFHR